MSVCVGRGAEGGEGEVRLDVSYKPFADGDQVGG